MKSETFNIDAFSHMNTMIPETVSLIMFDGPYYRVKGDFDFQFSSRQEWQAFQERMAIGFKKILKSNGSLFVWGDARNIAYQQIIFDKYFRLLNYGVWEKIQCQQKRSKPEDMRRFMPVTERWLFYDQGEDESGNDMIFSTPDCFQSIKKYMRQEAAKIREHFGFKTVKAFNEYINKITKTSSVASRHYFADSQWCLPTAEMYARLQTSGFFRRPYNTVKREYEELRRPFNLSDKLKYDVVRWSQEDQQTRKSNHPTKKPPGLIREMIKTTTRPGDLVYDPCHGSGTTQRCCHDLGLDYIGNEIDEGHFKESEKLYKLHTQEPDIFQPEEIQASIYQEGSLSL